VTYTNNSHDVDGRLVIHVFPALLSLTTMISISMILNLVLFPCVTALRGAAFGGHVWLRPSVVYAFQGSEQQILTEIATVGNGPVVGHELQAFPLISIQTGDQVNLKVEQPQFLDPRRSRPDLNVGKFECYSNIVTSIQPMTLAQCSPQQDGILTFYDVYPSPPSKRYNLSMAVNPTGYMGPAISRAVDFGLGWPSPHLGFQNLINLPPESGPSLLGNPDVVLWLSHSSHHSDEPMLSLTPPSHRALSPSLARPSSLFLSVIDPSASPVCTCIRATTSGSSVSATNLADSIADTIVIPSSASSSGGISMRSILNVTAPWAVLVPCGLVAWLVVR